MPTTYTTTVARSIVENLPRMTESEVRRELAAATSAVRAARPGSRQLANAKRVQGSARYALDKITANACEWCAGTREEHKLPDNRCTTPQFGTPAE